MGLSLIAGLPYFSVRGFECSRCGHKWVARPLGTDAEPLECPHCKSARWNRPVDKTEISERMRAYQEQKRRERGEKEAPPKKHEEYPYASIAVAGAQQKEEQPKSILMAEQKQEDQQHQPTKSKSRRDSDTPRMIEKYLHEDATDLMRRVDIAKILNLDRHNTAYALSKLVKQGVVIQPVKGMYRHKDNSKVKQ